MVLHTGLNFLIILAGIRFSKRQFSPFSCYIPYVRHKHLLQQPIRQHTQPVFPSMGKKNSQTYNKGKRITLPLDIPQPSPSIADQVFKYAKQHVKFYIFTLQP